jgi:hypothetical protein
VTPRSTAADFNSRCDCVGTDIRALAGDLDRRLASGPGTRLLETHPHLFSEIPVFIDAAHSAAMRELIRAVHSVVRLPSYRRAALAEAPAIAGVEPRTRGVFDGFDFHITADGPRLIEINTNAGGALLNAAARRALVTCCPDADTSFPPQPDADSLERRFVTMFESEWSRARGSDLPLRTIAIVDDSIDDQYLQPEFELFRQLFVSHGYRAFIADARELELCAAGLAWRGERIDLVYNRLTDFYFDAPEHDALRRAYEADLAVITPHPRGHALLADKRNLARLTDANFLRSIGASAADVTALTQYIPRTELVGDDRERWWSDRRRWFFKPAHGFASRGAYRGDKLTTRVFAEILRGRYVAQLLAPPGERQRARAAGRETFKVDIRHYTYGSESQLVAARLYQGQTTNFRTAGGGFAPVRECAN